MTTRKPGKKSFTKKHRKDVCECTTRSGLPKTMYSQRWLAQKAAGELLDKGKPWQTYRCPEGGGWHIRSVRWNPWEEAG